MCVFRFITNLMGIRCHGGDEGGENQSQLVWSLSEERGLAGSGELEENDKFLFSRFLSL